MKTQKDKDFDALMDRAHHKKPMKQQSDSVVKVQPEHTPTPWFRTTPDETYPGVIVNQNTMSVIGRTYSIADADFIVKAVNSHEPLLEALKLAKQCLKDNRGPNMDEFHKISEAIARAEGIAE